MTKLSLFTLLISAFPAALAAPEPKCAELLLDHLTPKEFYAWNAEPERVAGGIYVIRLDRGTDAEVDRIGKIFDHITSLRHVREWQVATPEARYFFIDVNAWANREAVRRLAVTVDPARLSSHYVAIEIEPSEFPLPEITAQMPLAQLNEQTGATITEPTFLRGTSVARSGFALPLKMSLHTALVTLRSAGIPLHGLKLRLGRTLTSQLNEAVSAGPYFHALYQGLVLVSGATYEAFRQFRDAKLPGMVQANFGLPLELANLVALRFQNRTPPVDRSVDDLIARLRVHKFNLDASYASYLWTHLPAPSVNVPERIPRPPKTRPTTSIVRALPPAVPEAAPAPAKPRGTKYLSLGHAREILALLSGLPGGEGLGVHAQLILAAKHLDPAVAEATSTRALNKAGLKKSDVAVILGDVPTTTSVAHLEAAWRWLESLTPLAREREITGARIAEVGDILHGRTAPAKPVHGPPTSAVKPPPAAASAAAINAVAPSKAGEPSLNDLAEDPQFTPEEGIAYVLHPRTSRVFRTEFRPAVIKNLFLDPALRANYSQPLLRAMLRGFVAIDRPDGIKRIRSTKHQIVIESRKFGTGCLVGRIEGDLIVVEEFQRKLPRR